MPAACADKSMAPAVPTHPESAPTAPPPLRLLERRPPLRSPALPQPWLARLGHWVDRLLMS
jgi:hypothetical protein